MKAEPAGEALVPGSVLGLDEQPLALRPTLSHVTVPEQRRLTGPPATL